MIFVARLLAIFCDAVQSYKSNQSYKIKSLILKIWIPSVCWVIILVKADVSRLCAAYITQITCTWLFSFRIL